jgi:hypothetical protein
MATIPFSDLFEHAMHYESKAIELIRELVGFPTVAFRELEARANIAFNAYLAQFMAM